ncbi:class I SAM-dependent methyltransferase [Novosphingobium album (ex Liu et al. 2023)]|uniref:Class I SAM-dependent methyltransferase n=1 Tax=Novosphingobium album (ex Liu et al. 2023) TaxID=3031130 RepID=A0ABT5WST7_9SPHN|nr:class I SAM-dependent methyltransferase [Novosphingobium album (ex Liu et al. 2023)]MDE8652302.1 class I SAM-dependent methyltransferase [Novosphingobium album (ex Liu et al. 2023)]
MAESRYVNGGYLERNPSWHSEDSPVKAAWIDAVLRRNSLDPKSVAEIGTGAGGVLAGLQTLRPNSRYIGFEISPQAFSLAQSRAKVDLDFRLEDMILTGRSGYDLLLAIDVFEHVPDYIGFLRALVNRATYKLFHIPLDMSVQMLLRRGLFQDIRRNLGHLHYFSRETAFDTLADCGYEIVDWNYTFWSRELPDLPLRTRIANVPRRLLAGLNEDFAVRMMGGASVMVLTR